VDGLEVLTPKEAAALLRLNLDTVRRLLREGQLPGCKVGARQWRIRRTDLEEYLRPRRAKTTMAAAPGTAGGVAGRREGEEGGP
jgi:excisionase family DNA binding protein